MQLKWRKPKSLETYDNAVCEVHLQCIIQYIKTNLLFLTSSEGQNFTEYTRGHTHACTNTQIHTLISYTWVRLRMHIVDLPHPLFYTFISTSTSVLPASVHLSGPHNCSSASIYKPPMSFCLLLSRQPVSAGWQLSLYKHQSFIFFPTSTSVASPCGDQSCFQALGSSSQSNQVFKKLRWLKGKLL